MPGKKSISQQLMDKYYVPDTKVESTNIKKPKQQTLQQIKEADKQKQLNDLLAKQGQLKASNPQGALSKAWEIAKNPVTAFSYKAKGQDIPDNFSRGEKNIYDNAVSIINPATYAQAAYNTASNILSPIQTAKTLGKATTNALSNLTDSKNVFNDNSNQEALGILGDAAITTSILSGVKNGFNIADRQFSKVGQQLEKIRMEGEAAGLDSHTIAKNQMEQVGITSNQREAYRPILSNFAEKYVTPYGYEGMGGEGKLKQTLRNIKQGGVNFDKEKEIGNSFVRTEISNERNDAWKLYLGKPQTKGTFSLAETAPVNHPNYSGSQLKNMDIYSLESPLAKLGIEPNYVSPQFLNPYGIEENMDLLRRRVNIDSGNEVMGGYNRLLSKDGMQYNDIWDLNKPVVPSRYVPKKFQDKLDENPLLYKKTQNGYLPRSFNIPADKFLGKPFLSHGTLPYTSQNLVDNMTGALKGQLKELTNSGVDMTMAPRIAKYEKYMEELKNYPKYKDGGTISMKKKKNKKEWGGDIKNLYADPVNTNYNWLNTNQDINGNFPPTPINPNQPQQFVQPNYANPQNGGSLNNNQIPTTPTQDKKAKPIQLMGNNPNGSPNWRVQQEDKQQGNYPGEAIGAGIVGALGIANSLLQSKPRRRYLRPEDLATSMPNQYGTSSQAISKNGKTIKGKKCDTGAVIDSVVGFVEATASKNKPQEYQNLNNLYELGGKLTNKNGALQALEGGNAPVISANMFDGGTGMFQGKSHDDGGIQATYMGKPFEAEGGEPYRIDSEGGLEIFGNLKNPVTGNKFKKDAKVIAHKEQKVNKLVNTALEVIDTTPIAKDKFSLMKINSGTAMLKGGIEKQKELADSKEHLSTLQKIMLDAKGEAKYAKDGMNMYPDGGKPWKFNGTKRDKLDEKIKGFVKLIEEKGLEGFSGSKSGYDIRNTKSGRPSRHASNQALDMMFKNPDAYKQILADPELSSYLYNNGLTAINEYDPKVASKTGATAGHLHIGYDKGTATSDQFRNDYRGMYSASKAPSVPNPVTSPYKGVNAGDAQTEQIPPYNFPNMYTPGQLKTKVESPYPETPLQFSPVKKETWDQPQHKFPWEQVLPVVPQLFDKPDPVKAQLYNPDLFNSYQVSFQDRRNQNQAQLKGIAKAAGYDPSALGALGAQAYNANDSVNAEEFRVNQGIFNEVQNKNVALLNDAKGKNLQILDTQYTRQAQAIGNTRDRRIQAGIQLGDVIANNNYENKALDISKNLYKDYSFQPNGELTYTSKTTAGDRMNAISPLDYPSPTSSVVTTKQGNQTTKQTYAPLRDELLKKRIEEFQYKKSKDNPLFPKKAKGGTMTQSTLAKLMYS
jgi:hypothetical protein